MTLTVYPVYCCHSYPSAHDCLLRKQMSILILAVGTLHLEASMLFYSFDCWLPGLSTGEASTLDSPSWKWHWRHQVLGQTHSGTLSISPDTALPSVTSAQFPCLHTTYRLALNLALKIIARGPMCPWLGKLKTFTTSSFLSLVKVVPAWSHGECTGKWKWKWIGRGREWQRHKETEWQRHRW